MFICFSQSYDKWSLHRFSSSPWPNKTFHMWLCPGGIHHLVIMVCKQVFYKRRIWEKRQMKKKVIVLTLYAVSSIGFGILSASTLFADISTWKGLWVLLSPPLILWQTLLAILGIELNSEIVINITLTALSLLYYFIMFYPPYRLTAPSKNSTTKSRGKLKILTSVFAIIHLVMIFIATALFKAWFLTPQPQRLTFPPLLFCFRRGFLRRIPSL